MSNVITADEIDFALYMDSTEAEHKVRSSMAFRSDVRDYFHGERRNAGAVMPWAKTHDKIRFRPAEVTVWSGLNGHGKSLVLGQTCSGFVDQGLKVCIASFEMRPVVTLARMCRQVAASARPAPEVIDAFHAATNNKLYLYDQQGSVRPEMVLAVARYCADKLNVHHFVIDSLMKCGVPEDGPQAFNLQRDFMDRLCCVAKDTGMHLHLVAHSRKPRTEADRPGKYDVKGSGTFSDQADNIITVWRNKEKEEKVRTGEVVEADKPDAILGIEKQRNGEWEGSVGLWYLPASLQFIEHSGGYPMPLLKLPKAGI